MPDTANNEPRRPITLASRFRGAVRWSIRKWWVVPLLLIAYWLAGDCFCRDKWMMSEGTAPDSFAKLPGVIGVTLTMGSNNIIRFQFHDGRAVRVAKLPEPDEFATSYGRPGGAEWAPRNFGDLYVRSEGPYQKSPDGRFLAAGAYVLIPKIGSATWYRSANLIIVDLATREVIARIDSKDDWGVHAIAWSPDGRYIAFLRRQSRWGSCLFEKLAHGIGHPVPIDSIYLDVIDRQGNIVASADLALELRYLSGLLVWTEDSITGEKPEG